MGLVLMNGWIRGGLVQRAVHLIAVKPNGVWWH